MKLFPIISLFFIHSLFAQERVSIEFKYGRVKVPNEQLGDFIKFLKNYKKEEIDSVHFIGSSDSAGIFWSNFRMTEFRSRRIKKICASTLGNSIPYKILPTLNKGAGELRNIRAVDVIVYAHEKSKKTELYGIRKP